MDEKELYRQKHRAQLDEWKADIAKLRAKVAGAKADAQLEMNKHLTDLDHKTHDAGARLADLAAANEKTWDGARQNLETTWAAIKAGVHAAAGRLKQ